jgi:hypothetical protein
VEESLWRNRLDDSADLGGWHNKPILLP